MSMRRFFIPASLLLAGFTISACTAILVPDEKDDGVARCNTTEDCDDPDDNRYIAQCVFGQDQPENSDKVCAPDFAEVNCHPDAFEGDDPFTVIYEEVTSNQGKAAYVSCTAENKGKQGCPPNDSGGCEAGLEIVDTELNICDDPDGLFPAINPAKIGLESPTDIAGQDVADQFCRFYFCDESFVCDPSGSKRICKPCDPAREYGDGGCGTLYLQGAPSSVYTSLDNANCSGNKAKSDAVYGTAPEVPAP